MTIEEQFSEIIQGSKKKELIPFLKSLTAADKKLLTTPIKKFSKEYWEYGDIGGGAWGHIKGNGTQRDMLQTACFVCSNKTDYEKSQMTLWFIRKEQLQDIITWYVPDWFSDYVNKEASGDGFSLPYDWIMELTEMGALKPSPELLVNSIPAILYEHKDKQWHYRFENLLKYPVTVREHIWYLFDYPSNLHYSNRFLYFGKDVSKEEKKDWQYAFKTLCRENRLDRERLLKESLLASNKNFNKILSGWFADLFTSLEPTTPELIVLQKELIIVLNAQQSKPATVAIQCLKKIIGEKDVDTAAIIDALPVVLSSSTKNLVSAALMLMEQIAKKEKTYQGAIGQLCCQVFIHHDETLQTRAAKIIDKYGEPSDELIKTQLLSYSDGLLQSPRKILERFLESDNGSPDPFNTTNTNNETPLSFSNTSTDNESPDSFPNDTTTNETRVSLSPIPPINTIDDLLFLAAQAFDNNESWHFDLLPATLVRMQQELKGPALSQLQPALQRALKMTRGGMRSTNGFYDHMLAIFFIDVCIHLVRKHPADAADLQKVFDSFDVKQGDKIEKWLAIQEGESYIAHWSNHYQDPYYKPFKHLLTEALNKIRRGDSLPLLSTPTHQPAWIAAETFVERLAQYQQQGVLAEATDAQLAIARCALTDTARGIAAAKQHLQGEWQQLVLFLLQPGAEPQPPFSQPEAWMMASLSKHPKKEYAAFESFGYYYQGLQKYTGQLAWVSISEEYDAQQYDYKLQKTVTTKQTRKFLNIDFPWHTNKKDKAQQEGQQGFFARLFNKHKTKPASPPSPLIYDYFRINATYLSNENNDIRRALLMAPNNIEVLLPQVLYRCIRIPAHMGESDKKMVVATLQLLHELWDEAGEMAHLFLATSMLCLDKTAAGTAAEVWLKYAPLNKIDNALLGRIIGRHESIEFAPLKRFTDLIMQSLFRVSATHNRMLQAIIENIIPELPDTPIKNLKKLLEILSELAALNKQPVTDQRVRERLEVWKGTEGLKKVGESLLLS